MSTLANVFEAAGLATIGISLVRGQAESARPPRILNVDFPLGRPLGRPGDPAFQHEVLAAAFALLERTDSPVLVDHPVVIEDEVAAPASCPLPPRTNDGLPPEVDEVVGIRAAYDRHVDATGRTSVGRLGDADSIRSMVESFLRIEDGDTLDDVGWTEWDAVAASQDIRLYYEEAALQLADARGARQGESWFYGHTATGQLLKRAMAVVAESGESKLAGMYLVPMSQQG